MKKIILFLLLNFCFILTAQADLNVISYNVSSSEVSICMDNESYAIRRITSPQGNLYFLNPSHNYNYHLSDYYPISWEESPYDSKITEYTSYFPKHLTKPYYYESTVKKIWDTLYPGHFPYFCTSSSNLVNAMVQTEELMVNVEAGPDYINYPHYLKEGEEFTFTFTYFDNFYIASSGGLDAKIEGNKLTARADSPGKYELVLKRQENGLSPSKLYTDGTNYLVTSGAFPDKEYRAIFYVGYKKFTFIPKDASGSPLSNANFTLYKEGEKYLDIMTNYDGVYEGYLPVGEYFIENESGSFKEYFFIEDDFSLETYVQDNNNPVVSSPESTPVFVQNAQELALSTILKDSEKEENTQEKDTTNEEVSVIFPDTLWLT